MATEDWIRISRLTRDPDRAYPYTWWCVVPVTTGLITEACGTVSVAATKAQAREAHRVHFNCEHGEESR